MAKPRIIKIENHEYTFDSLSDDAKQQLTNLNIVDQEIARLQRQLVIAQTARNVYATAVKNNLPAKDVTETPVT
jgi:hypothetical protein